MVETLTSHEASVLWLIPAIPLAVATLNLFLGKRLGRWAGRARDGGRHRVVQRRPIGSGAQSTRPGCRGRFAQRCLPDFRTGAQRQFIACS